MSGRSSIDLLVQAASEGSARSQDGLRARFAQARPPPLSNASFASKLLPASVLASWYARQMQQELGLPAQQLSSRQVSPRQHSSRQTSPRGRNSPSRARTPPFGTAPWSDLNCGFSTLAAHGNPVPPQLPNGSNPPSSVQSALVHSAPCMQNPPQRESSTLHSSCNGDPNPQAVAAKIAALEAGEAAIVTASGMAAVSTTLLTFLKAGDHMLVQRTLHGRTHGLVHQDLAALGISNTVIDASMPATWQAALKPNTEIIYVESISNPTVEVPDLQAVVAFARQHGLLAIIDNTLATPVNFRPLLHGFHLVLHSAANYLDGHADVSAGAVVGRAQLIQQINAKLLRFGGELDAHSCFLLHRGIKTLSLRVQQQNANAQALAEFLEGHPRVVQHVAYPGLPCHPQHAQASDMFRSQGCGGVLSFELHGGVAAAESCLQALQLVLQASSLGGVATAVTRPAVTSHAALSPQERATAGISEALIRVAVGIEDTSDLLSDFAEALRQGSS